MPRSLARSGYTHEEVLAQVTAGQYRFTPRFELVDGSYQRIDDLAVTSASVEFDSAQVIPYSLHFDMLPRPDLLDVPFQFLVQAWFDVGMPDGGYAEIPMGAYPLVIPTRVIDEIGAEGSGLEEGPVETRVALNPESWTFILGGQMHYLDVGGVGPQGFSVLAGTPLTDGLRAMLARMGFDPSDVQLSDSRALERLDWTLRAGGQRSHAERTFVPGPGPYGTTMSPFGVWYLRYVNKVVTNDLEDPTTKWSGVARELHMMLGYDPPHFSLDTNRYVARPAVDYAQIDQAPVLQYTMGDPNGLLLPGIVSTPDLSKIGNRATVTARNSSGTNDVGVADLNTLLPGHPLSQAVCRQYIEVAATLDSAASQPQLQAAAVALLNKSIRGFETVPVETVGNPAHEAWDVVGLQVPGDPVYDTNQLMAETSWTFDLFRCHMRHNLARLFIPAPAQ